MSVVPGCVHSGDTALTVGGLSCVHTLWVLCVVVCLVTTDIDKGPLWVASQGEPNPWTTSRGSEAAATPQNSVNAWPSPGRRGPCEHPAGPEAGSTRRQERLLFPTLVRARVRLITTNSFGCSGMR